MTRPSPLQVLDADMPKWAAGGWKPGDAAGVLAALEEAGYVVVERSAGNEAAETLRGWMEFYSQGSVLYTDNRGERWFSPIALFDEALAAERALDRLDEKQLAEALRYELHFDRKHGFPEGFGPEDLAVNIFDTHRRILAERSEAAEEVERTWNIAPDGKEGGMEGGEEF